MTRIGNEGKGTIKTRNENKGLQEPKMWVTRTRIEGMQIYKYKG